MVCPIPQGDHNKADTHQQNESYDGTK